MPRFPVDAPKASVIRTFEVLGFSLRREAQHISMIRENEDGSTTPLTIPNHHLIIEESRVRRSGLCARSLGFQERSSWAHTNERDSIRWDLTQNDQRRRNEGYNSLEADA